MRKFIKKAICFLSRYFPVLFFGFLVYTAPSVYIKEISLYVSARLFFVMNLVVCWLWAMGLKVESKPALWIWNFIRNLALIELVCYIFFFQYHFKASLMIAGIFFLFEFGIIYLLRKKRKKKASIRSKLYRYNIVIKRTSAMLIVCLLTIPSVMVFFEYGFQQPSSGTAIIKKLNSDTSMEYLAYQNREVLQNLKSSIWNTMSDKSKMDILQTVANIETTHLTIEPLALKEEKLKNNALGEYGDGTIYIDSDVLSTAEAREALVVICHECRHAYQHEVVTMLDWSDETVLSHYYYETVRQWKMEFENYKGGEDEYDEYYNQGVEADAREYAEKKAQYYMEFIAEP